MWFFKVLAWIGVLYEVLKCLACAVEIVVRKGETPKGWIRERSKDGSERCYCPRCGL